MWGGGGVLFQYKMVLGADFRVVNRKKPVACRKTGLATGFWGRQLDMAMGRWRV